MSSTAHKWLKRLFWLIFIGLFFALITGIFFVYQYFQSRGVSLEINGPNEVYIGVPFELSVNFQNQSQNVLKNASLNLFIPEGTVLLDAETEQKNISEKLGDIGLGSFSQKTFRFAMTSDGNTKKKFSVSLNYESVGAGQTRFETQQNWEIKTKESAVSLDLTLPDQISNGEKFAVQLDYRNLTLTDFSDLEFNFSYPVNFVWESAEPAPTKNNNAWGLKNLPAGEEGKIIFNGRLLGQPQSSADFAVKLTKNFLGRHYEINQKSAQVAIAASPLALTIYLNEQENYISRLNDSLIYNLIYQNNSDGALSDVVITAKLLGEMYNWETLQTNARFNSLTNVLTWDNNNQPELKMIPAGQNGAVSFQIKTREQFPIKRLSDKNYLLKTEAEIISATVPDYSSAVKTVGLAKLETKLAGVVKIETKAYFRDATSGILNRGPWPPKINQATQYTVHWLINDFAVDSRDLDAKTSLEPGVKWLGNAKSSNEILPIYNAPANEIIWQINKISANKGVINPPLEAIFQIEATPALSQKGNFQPLLKETIITAFDEFSETRLQNFSPAVSTELPDDASVSQIKGIVTE